MSGFVRMMLGTWQGQTALALLSWSSRFRVGRAGCWEGWSLGGHQGGLLGGGDG